MENQHEMNISNRMPVLVIGILITIASVIMFAIGYTTSARFGLWVAAVVVGVIASAMLTVSAYSSKGWTRLAALFFMATQIVFITIIATLYFGGMNMEM